MPGRQGDARAAAAKKSNEATKKKAESTIAKGKPKDKDTHNMREFKNRRK
jgi:hypothetical protein